MKILSGIRYNNLILFILLTLCIFFAINFPINATSLYKSNYTVLLISLIFCSILLSTKLMDKNLFIFDPFLFSSFLFFCVFLIQPMIDIIKNTVVAYYDLQDPSYGCQRGTLIFVVSYIVFYIGYFFRKSPNRTSHLYSPITKIDKTNIAFFSFILWIVFTLFCVIFFIANGYSIIYIFTLGQLGHAQVNEIFARMGFLWKFSTSMIVCFMYYLTCGRSRLVKLIMFAITLTILILNGGRAILLILLAAPIVYYYTKRAKNIPMRYIAIALALFLLISATVQAARWGLRSGGEVQVETQWNMDTILYPMRSNFGVYKMYYFVVATVPEKTNYLWGKETILYTLVMFIPRVIWPDKPDAPFRDVLRYAAGDHAVMQGEAFPGLTEFYMDFGIVGCMFFSFLLGWLVSKLKNLYLHSRTDTHGLILFSVLYPFLFQVIIRGYIPSLFYTLVCIFLPYIVLKVTLTVFRNRII